MLLTGLSIGTIGLFKHGGQLLLALLGCVIEVVCVLVWLVVDVVLEGLTFLGNTVVVTLTMGLAFPLYSSIDLMCSVVYRNVSQLSRFW